MKKKWCQLITAVLSAIFLTAGVYAPVRVYAEEDDDIDWDDIVYWDDDDDDDDDDSWDDSPDYYAYIITSAHDTDLKVGDSTQATASVQTNASSYAIEIRWSSDSPGVASVKGDGHFGYITGKGEGSAYITAHLYLEGNEVDSDSFSVTVRRPEPPKPAEPTYVSVNGISISTTSLQMYSGEQKQISASAQPSNANNRGISWSTNNDYVASVGQDGTIYGKNAGTAVITARTNENGYTAYVNVTVYGENPNTKVQNVSVNPTSVTLAINQYMYITPSVWPATANQGVTWTSSNPGIVTVTRDGKITGVAPGTAVITCIAAGDNSKTAKTTVNVGTAVAGQAAPAATAPAATTIPVMANTTRDPVLCFDITNKILAAAPGAAVTIASNQPMSYDINVATALKMRPDVTLVATFPFQGHNFSLTLPKAYDLAAQLDKSGYVEWLQLCTLKNGPVCVMLN